MMILIAVLLSTGCGKKDSVSDIKDIAPVKRDDQDTQNNSDKEQKETVEKEDTKEISHEGQALSPLTGEWIDEEEADRRPIAIMINNHKRAIPQSGIGQAGILYDVPVEGGINRLLAIFQEIDDEQIGPVRSARHYFLDMAFDYDAIYVHYGHSPQAEQAYNSLQSPHLEGLSYLDTIMCWRDPSREAPHNVYTNEEKLLAAWDTVGYRKEMKNDWKYMFSFNDMDIELKNGKKAEKITIPYSYYQTSSFEYVPNKKVYKRFQFNEPHIDANTREQLTFKNIIIQFANVYQIPGDSYGRLNIDLVGKGEGIYITDGRQIPIHWAKQGHYTPTEWTDDMGNPLNINPGKTNVCIVPNEISVDFED